MKVFKDYMKWLVLFLILGTNFGCKTVNNGQSSVKSRTESLRGKFENHGFVVYFNGHEAEVRWDDGTRGIILPRIYNPNPAPRCACDIYEGGGRRLTIETDGDGRKYATYEKTGPSYRGNYKGHGFVAYISSDERTAQIAWDDGANGVVLKLTNNPDPEPRCDCTVYQAGSRQLILDKDPTTGRPTKAEYIKWD